MSSNTKFPKIALTGLSGAGKSEVARILREQYGYTEDYLSKTLKTVVELVFGASHDQTHLAELKNVVIPELGVSPRDLLTKIGTELFREELFRQLPNLKLRGGSPWIHSLLVRLDNIKNTPVVISDVRFPDEEKALREAGFIIIEVVRKNQIVDKKINAHSSEQQVIKSDYQLVNPGDSLEALAQQVQQLVQLD